MKERTVEQRTVDALARAVARHGRDSRQAEMLRRQLEELRNPRSAQATYFERIG